MPVYQPIKPTLPKDYSSKNNYAKIFYIFGSIVLIIASIFFFALSLRDNYNLSEIDSKKENVSQEENKEIKNSNEQKNNQEKKANSQIYKVESGDTLYSIGLKFNIDWHKIASVNKLKEPYNLTVGQELIIPSE